MALPRLTRVSSAVLSAALALSVAACSDDGGGSPTSPESTAASATAGTETTETSESTESSESSEPASTSKTDAEESQSESASASNRSTSAKAGELPEDVQEVAERFSSILPEKVFQELHSCTSIGRNDSWECTGPEVGSFLFFNSQAKAAQSTQQLTELRSSKVLRDTRDHVVGWSTLGTTAIITVVDNKHGLVVQQTVSTDIQDPEDRIYELGILEEPATPIKATTDDAAEE